MVSRSAWEKSLTISLGNQLATADLSNYLQDIFEWYSKANSLKADDLMDRLVSIYGEHELRIRFESVTDQLIAKHLVNNEALFTADMSPVAAKRLYRLLIRVFHPDRGSHDAAWLTARAEIINRSYKRFLTVNDVSKPEVQNKNEYIERQNSSSLNSSSANSVVYLTLDYWRDFFGDLKKLQNKIVACLAIVLILVVLIVAVSMTNEPSNEHLQAKKFKSNQTEFLASNASIEELSAPKLNQNDKPGTVVETADITVDLPDSDKSKKNIDTDLLDNGTEQLYLDNPIDNEIGNDIDEVAIDKKSHGGERTGEIVVEANVIDDSAVTDDVEVLEVFAAPKKIAKIDPHDSLQVDRSGGSIGLKQTSPKIIDEVEKILDQYQQYYSLGNEQQVVRLFLSSAHENHYKGVEEIQDYYKYVFDQTSERSIDIIVTAAVYDEIYTATINGELILDIANTVEQVSLRYDFEMTIIKTQSGYKVAVFEWGE